jgi:hypothetical protein
MRGPRTLCDMRDGNIGNICNIGNMATWQHRHRKRDL